MMIDVDILRCDCRKTSWPQSETKHCEVVFGQSSGDGEQEFIGRFKGRMGDSQKGTMMCGNGNYMYCNFMSIILIFDTPNR